MTRKPRDDKPILSTKDSLEQELLANLERDRDACPDLTRSIMGRLGYMRASDVVVRRRRVRLWLHRGFLATAAGLAVMAGIHVFNQGTEARRPAELPVYEALERDVQRQTQGFGQLIQTIRRINPPAVPDPKPVLPEPVEASEAGESPLPREAKGFRWI